MFSFQSRICFFFLGLLALGLGFSPKTHPSKKHSRTITAIREPQQQPHKSVWKPSTVTMTISNTRLMARLSRSQEALRLIDEMKRDVERKKKQKRKAEAEYAELLAANEKFRRMLESSPSPAPSSTEPEKSSHVVVAAAVKREGILPFLQALYFPWWGMIKEIFK